MGAEAINICIIGVGNIAIHHINGIIRNKKTNIRLFLVDKDKSKVIFLKNLIEDRVDELILLNSIDPSISYDCIINCLPYQVRQKQSSWNEINNSTYKVLIVEKPLGSTDLRNIKTSKTVVPYIRAIDLSNSLCAKNIAESQSDFPGRIEITEHISIEPTMSILLDLHSHLLSVV